LAACDCQLRISIGVARTSGQRQSVISGQNTSAEGMTARPPVDENLNLRMPPYTSQVLACAGFHTILTTCHSCNHFFPQTVLSHGTGRVTVVEGRCPSCQQKTPYARPTKVKRGSSWMELEPWQAKLIQLPTNKFREKVECILACLCPNADNSSVTYW